MVETDRKADAMRTRPTARRARRPPDALTDMLDDLRRARPPVFQADEWAQWEGAIAQTIRAIGSPWSRWAALVLVANDLAVGVPGMSLVFAYGYFQGLVSEP